jgi:hypothetical protein
VTQFEYGSDGRVSQTISRREPEFTPNDLRLLAAHVALESRPRGSHGELLEEATDARADPSTPGGWRYVANEKPRIDYAAKAVADAQDAFYEKWPKVSKNGHQWHVTRVDDPSVAAEQERALPDDPAV